MSGSVKSETVHLIFVLHFAPSLLIFSQYCLCKKSCLPSDKGCRQIPWLGGKLIKWSGINQSLALTFPSKLLLPGSELNFSGYSKLSKLQKGNFFGNPNKSSSSYFPQNFLRPPLTRSELKTDGICGAHLLLTIQWHPVASDHPVASTTHTTSHLSSSTLYVRNMICLWKPDFFTLFSEFWVKKRARTGFQGSHFFPT